MIKKLGMAALAITMATGVASSAQADGWGRHEHYRGNGGGNGGALIGGLIGGMILGGIMAQPRYQQPQYGYSEQYYYGDMDEDQGYVPYCRTVIIGQRYDGRPVFRRVCQ